MRETISLPETVTSPVPPTVYTTRRTFLSPSQEEKLAEENPIVLGMDMRRSAERKRVFQHALERKEVLEKFGIYVFKEVLLRELFDSGISLPDLRNYISETQAFLSSEPSVI